MEVPNAGQVTEGDHDKTIHKRETILFSFVTFHCSTMHANEDLDKKLQPQYFESRDIRIIDLISCMHT